MNGAASVVGSIAEASPWLAAAAVLACGMVVAVLLGVVLSELPVLLNALCDRIGVSEFLRKGRARNTPARLVAILVLWVVPVYPFLQIARILDIGVLRSVSDRIAESAPGVAAALFTGVIRLVVIAFLANSVETLARIAAYPHARLLARVVRAVGGAHHHGPRAGAAAPERDPPERAGARARRRRGARLRARVRPGVQGPRP